MVTAASADCRLNEPHGTNGSSGNTWLVPANTTVPPKRAFKSACGKVIIGPPMFVPSLSCSVICCTDVFEPGDVRMRFRPTVHPEAEIGTSAIEVGSPLVTTTIAGAVTIADFSLD